MCKIIAITNQKGGCSKTTSTVNIGIGLARAGKSVLLIDADAQGSLTASLGFKRPDEIGITLATIMAKTINEEDIELKRAILKHEEGVDLIPGNIELSGLEVQLSNVLSRELILKEFVDSIREEYEYILIDCAPSLGMMTINALVAADEVIIPVQAAYLPVKGLQQLIKTINMVKRRLNKKLQVGGILLAMVDYRTNYAKNISAQLYEAYGTNVGLFKTYVTYRMLVEFLADEEIEHISEMDYILRKKYEVYMSELIKEKSVSRYLRIFDKVKQEYIRKRIETPMGRLECQWTYKNTILFIPYHSDQKIVLSVERVKNRSNMVWDFQIDSSEKMKRQIFDVLEFILENYEPSRVREQKLTGLHIFYEFCRLRKIEDINCLEQVQEEDFQIFLERKIENEQRRNRLRSIVGLACRITFLQTKEIRWDATIWYLEKFKIPKERLNPSDPVERISFREVLHPENRKLLQEYMKYEIGIGEMAISTVYEKFRIIRNFLKEISDEQQKVTTCDAERIDQYLKKRQEDANEAKTFNTQVTSIQYFFKFLEVRGYVDKVPFRAEYYWEKQILVHHDRCVEEDVYMEIIQKLSNFPEHLRMMFLHLWCIGLRISEVCTLKGDAYYRQKGDYWMKIYQVKMKNYKRVPIPEALYDLMQVYLNKNRIAKEDYIFQNRKGGAFSKSTFNEQMKKYCAACDIQNGEYLFKSHDYRHTVATNLYDHGVSRQGIRDYLGHNYEEMTMQYIDYMPKKIARRNVEYFSDEKNSLLSYVQKGEKDERKS